MGEFSDLIFTAAGYLIGKSLGEDKVDYKAADNEYVRQKNLRAMAVKMQKKLLENTKKLGAYHLAYRGNFYWEEGAWEKAFMGMTKMEYMRATKKDYYVGYDEWVKLKESSNCKCNDKHAWHRDYPTTIAWEYLEKHYRDNPYLLWMYKRRGTELGSKYCKLRHCSDGKALEELSADTIGIDREGNNYGKECVTLEARDKYNMKVRYRKYQCLIDAIIVSFGVPTLGETMDDVLAHFPIEDHAIIYVCIKNGVFHENPVWHVK